MPTFTQVFTYLKKHKGSLRSYLEIPEDYEKQETVLRLFGVLGCIEAFQGWKIMAIEFNKPEGPSNFDINSFMDKNVKDSGSASDFTLFKDDQMLAISSKNYEKGCKVGDYDLSEIEKIHRMYHSQMYPKLVFGIVVRDKKVLHQILEKARNTSKHNVEILRGAIQLDWNDLETAYQTFLLLDGIPKVNIKKVLSLRVHQQMGVQECMKALRKYGKTVLGFLPRAGKTYVAGGVILEFLRQNPNLNVLFSTTCPTETISQYLDVFNYEQFSTMTVITKESPNKKGGESNIVIISKQYIQNPQDEKLNWIKKFKFDLLITDETDSGGTTDISSNSYEVLTNNCPVMHITSTYGKVTQKFNVPKDAHVLFGIDAIHEFARGDFSKFGNDVIQRYNKQYIQDEYKQYPSLQIVSHSFRDSVKEELKTFLSMCSNGTGFSTSSMLHVENGSLSEQGKKAFTEMIKYIFGVKKESGNFHIEEGGVIMRRINEIRYSKSSQAPEIETILVFLPCGNITKLSNILKDITSNLLPNYNIICVNTEEGKSVSAKEVVSNAIQECKYQKKKGLFVFLGKMLSRGVSIPECDIVLMLNNTPVGDLSQQMYYRGMTPRQGKTCGFVIDLNIQRSAEWLIEVAKTVKPESHPKHALEYLFKQQLIGFNFDEHTLQFNSLDMEIIEQKLFDYHIQANPIKYLSDLFTGISFKISKKEWGGMLNKPSKLVNTLPIKELEGKDIDIPIGITVTTHKKPKDEEKKKKENTEEENEEENEEEKENTEVKEDTFDIVQDVIVKLIPLIAILSASEKNVKTFGDMMDFILIQPLYTELKEVLYHQIMLWWKASENTLEKILTIYQNELSLNPEFEKGCCIVHELFKSKINNPEDLSKAIDEYFTPMDNERKENAEISTPYKLRKDMLDSVPSSFWKNKSHRVFEPCCGKGGFVIDVYARFFEGLEDSIPNEMERKKWIIEKCLFFSDINPFNVFITNLILNCSGEYKTNCYTGDALKFNPSEHFGISSFNLIVGNPPYNSGGVKSFTGKLLSTTQKNKTIWPDFVSYSLALLSDSGYLLYVTPLSWLRKSHSIHSMMLSKQIWWLRLYDNSATKKLMSADIPVSAYLLQNIPNTQTTNISSILARRSLTTTGTYGLVSGQSVPLSFYSIFEKLSKFISSNEKYRLRVHKVMAKTTGTVVPLPKEYTVSDNYSVETYRIKDGIQVKKMISVHPHQKDNKLIIANKASYTGCFIDNGRLGLSGNDKFYILDTVQNLQKIQKYLLSNLGSITSHFTKYRQDFLDECSFDFVPNVGEIDYETLDELYHLIGFSNEEIECIQKFK